MLPNREGIIDPCQLPTSDLSIARLSSDGICERRCNSESRHRLCPFLVVAADEGVSAGLVQPQILQRRDQTPPRRVCRACSASKTTQAATFATKLHKVFQRND